MSARRIAFDARYISDRYHGIGRYAFNLLRALAQASPDDYFIAFTGRDLDSRFDLGALASLPNLETRPGPWPLYWPHEQFAWPLLLAGEHIDIFHSPYFNAPIAPIPGWRPPALVLTIHDLIFERFPEFMPSPWLRAYFQLLVGSALRRASKVICVSHATAKDLRACYPVPETRIAVTHEGVDEAFSVQADTAETRRRYRLSRPFLLNVGVRRPHKNLAVLVEAFADIAGETSCDLVFAGPADERFPDQAKIAAEASRLNGRVRFLDWVPEADLPALYALAEAVVLPSRIEGFGLPALEAMAQGTPVIASIGTSYDELVAGAGLLVPTETRQELADGLRVLLADAGLRCELRSVGRQRAASFSWAETARKTLDVYDEVAP